MTANFSQDDRIRRLLTMHPLFLHHSEEVDILVFRRIIERAQKFGFWNGSVAQVS